MGQLRSNRSLCGWEYVAEPYNPARVPACIHEVAACVNRVAFPSENQCEMVHVVMSVRDVGSARWSYVALPVACTLAAPPFHASQFRRPARIHLPLH